jgi:hypothetical protein
MKYQNKLIIILSLQTFNFNTTVYAANNDFYEARTTEKKLAASSETDAQTEAKKPKGFILAPTKNTKPTGTPPKPSTGIRATNKSMATGGGGFGGTSLMACDSEATPPTCYCHTISECNDMESECADPTTIKCKPQTSQCSCAWKTKTGTKKPVLENTNMKNISK